MVRLLAWLARFLGPRTVLSFLGLVLLGVGAALVYLPLGLIVTGALLFWLAVYPILRTPGKEG